MLALVIVTSNHIPITGHLTPAVQAPVVSLSSVIRPVARVHRRAMTSDTSDTNASATVYTWASEDGWVSRDYRARDGHARALELRMYGSRPATDATHGGWVRRCDMRGVTTRRPIREVVCTCGQGRY